eukprot:Sspe_Gene.80336::Locus_50664_Transcript_1_1_Confidence_1.000_Length_1384::g.80336::m.80336
MEGSVEVPIAPAATDEIPSQENSAAVPTIGPNLTVVGTVKRYGHEKRFGFLTPDHDPSVDIHFGANCVIGGNVQDAHQGCPAVFSVTPTAKGQRANQVVLLPGARSENGPVYVGRIKSYSTKNGYGFVNPWDSTTDYHFSAANCADKFGLQKGRACAFQVDNTASQTRNRCSFVQPLLTPTEALAHQQQQASQYHTPANPHPRPTAVDLHALGLSSDIINDPELAQVAQTGALEAVQRALRSGFANGRPQLAGALRGMVKSWSSMNKYGFIRTPQGEDVHVPVSALSGLQALTPGTEVDYTLDERSLPRKRAALVWDPTKGPHSTAGPIRGSAAPHVLPVTESMGLNLPSPPTQEPIPAGAFRPSSSGVGSVKSFNRNKGYGFVVDDATGQDVYFTATVADEGGVNPARGQPVGFSLAQTSQGGMRAGRMWPI